MRRWSIIHSWPKFSLRLYFSIYFLNRVSIVMLGKVHHFSSIAFRKALELISQSFSLTSCYLSASWFLSRNFLYRMIVTHILKYFKIDISGETACPPFVDIDHTILKTHARMLCPLMLNFHLSLLLIPLHLLQVHTLPWWTRWLHCPWVTQRTQLRFFSNQDEFRNTLTYVCSSQRYYKACTDYSFAQHEWPQAITTSYTSLLLVEGPPFELWIAPTEPIGVYRPVVDEPETPFYTADQDFIGMSELFLVSHLLDVDKRKKRSLGYLEILGSYFLFASMCLSLIHIWRCRRSTLCRSRWSPYH